MVREVPGPGLGDEEYPGFPADECPECLPDLSEHHSIVADVLKQKPWLYTELRHLKTPQGVGLAKCLKTGFDNRGHPMVKTVGLVAGDEQCYETFSRLFQLVIEQRYGEDPQNCKHVAQPDLQALSTVRADPSGQYVLSAQVRSARCLQGFRFPPAICKDERREVERLLVRALTKLDGDMQGEYYPLRDSQSCKPCMTQEQEAELRQARLLFECPDASATLSSGVGRHWPDARGIYVNQARSFSVWVNEDEHLRAIAIQSGDAVQDAFSRVALGLRAVEAQLQGVGQAGYAFNAKLGYLNSCPSNLGNALRVSMIVKVPLVTAKDRWMDWVSNRGLSARSAVDESGSPLQGLLEVSNLLKLGLSEVECVNLVAEGVAELVRAEQRLENGEGGLFHPDEIDRLMACTPENSEEEIANQEIWAAAGAAFGAVFHGAVEVQGDRPSRADIRGSLERAVDDGSLEEALLAMREGRQASDSEESVRSSLQQLLATAADDGSLEMALQDVQLEREEETLGLAASVLGLLDMAADSGALEAILSEVERDRDEEDQAIVDAIFGLFAAGADSGALEVALEEVERGRELADDKVLLPDTLRERVKDLLVTAAKSGELESALNTVCQTTESEVAPQMDALKENLKEMLVEAAVGGALENVLSNLSSQTQEPKLQELKESVRSLLEQAAHSGELAEALQEVNDSAEVGSRDVLATEAGRSGDPEFEAALQQDMRDVLLNAADSGDLVKVLEAIQAEKEPDKRLQDDLRDRVRECLLEAVDSGCLEDALEFAQVQQVRDSKEKARNALLAAADNGALARVLQEVEAEEPELDDALKHSLRELLLDAADSGSLENALENLQDERQQGQASLDATKGKLLGVLMEASDDGRLQAALQTEPPEQHGEVDLRVEVGCLLTAAAVSGALERVLNEMQNDKPEESDDELKLKILHVLSSASQKGDLLAALQKPVEQLVSDSLDVSKANVRDILLKSADDGRLAAALAEATADDPQDIRLDLRDLLMAASESGALADILQEIATERDQKQLQEGTMDLKGFLRDLLEAAADSGDLEHVLSEVKRSKDSKPPVADLRTQLRDVLLVAADDGSLRCALQEVGRVDRQRETAVDKDDFVVMHELTTRTRALLANAAESGELEVALQAVKMPTEGGVGVLRQEVKRAMEAALLGEDTDATATPTDVERLRTRMRECLEDSFDQQYGGQRGKEGLDMEGLQGMCKAASDALDAAFGDAHQQQQQQQEESTTIHRICESARSALEAALGDSSAEDPSSDAMHADICQSAREALEAALAEAEPPIQQHIKKQVGLPSIPPVPHVDVQKVGLVPAGLLQAVATADRRIGALLALIKETQRQIIDRDECCLALEAELATARRDSEAVGEELERHRLIMTEQDHRHTKLQAARTELCNNLDEETMKQRHANLELDMMMYTNRSEASTACTVSDLATPLGTATWLPIERPETALPAGY